MKKRYTPEHIRSDNGPEFIALEFGACAWREGRRLSLSGGQQDGPPSPSRPTEGETAGGDLPRSKPSTQQVGG